VQPAAVLYSEVYCTPHSLVHMRSVDPASTFAAAAAAQGRTRLGSTVLPLNGPLLSRVCTAALLTGQLLKAAHVGMRS
jgi:hypothetical protein